MKASRLPVDIYIRVSRVGKRGEKLISPADQEKRARELARDRGLTVGTVLPADLDESGGRLDRPGLQEALRRVESGESGGVIVAWLDRLSRDSEHAHALVRRITEAGGVIYAPDAPADWTTPEGELQAGILFAFAQYVRKRAGAGFERAKEQAIARGIPVNTRAPVGYRKADGEGEDRRLQLDPETALVVREVFERRARGEGPAALGAFLEAKGVRTSQGSKTWSKPAIYNLLSNRVYLGELSYGRDRRYLNPGAHEPLVDEATWQAAQHPNGRNLTPARSGDSSYLLSGLMRCFDCRYCLQGTTTSRGKRIYRCIGRRAGGICPAPARVDADLAEAVAVEAFWTLTTDIEAEGAADVADIEDRGVALERAERALKHWGSLEVQHAIGDLAEYAAGLRERRDARDHAARALGAARAAIAMNEAMPPVRTLRNSWEEMSLQDRRELLALRFDCLALRRTPKTLVLFPTGTCSVDLPRRGFKYAPSLSRFPDPPDGARVLAL